VDCLIAFMLPSIVRSILSTDLRCCKSIERVLAELQRRHNRDVARPDASDLPHSAVSQQHHLPFVLQVIERVLAELQRRQNTDPANPTLGVVRLAGLLHTDERTAFREIARQLCAEFRLREDFSRSASVEENITFLRAIAKELRRCCFAGTCFSSGFDDGQGCMLLPACSREARCVWQSVLSLSSCVATAFTMCTSYVSSLGAGSGDPRSCSLSQVHMMT